MAFVRKRTGSTDEQAAAGLARGVGGSAAGVGRGGRLHRGDPGQPGRIPGAGARADGGAVRAEAQPTRGAEAAGRHRVVGVARTGPGRGASGRGTAELCAFLAPRYSPEPASRARRGAARGAGRGDRRSPGPTTTRWGCLAVTRWPPSPRPRLGLHRLVQAVIRARLEGQANGSGRRSPWSCLSQLPGDSWELAPWPACQQLLPHVLAATEHAERLDVAREQAGRLLDRASSTWKSGTAPAGRAPGRAGLTLTQQALGPMTTGWATE